MSMLKNALQYVRNTAGGADKAAFMDDHDPVGDRLWADMTARGLVQEDSDGVIRLTPAGDAALDAA